MYNVNGLIEALGLSYKPNLWRLFNDSSPRSLKVLLLHKLTSVPIEKSIQLSKNYKTMKTLF